MRQWSRDRVQDQLDLSRFFDEENAEPWGSGISILWQILVEPSDGTDRKWCPISDQLWKHYQCMRKDNRMGNWRQTWKTTSDKPTQKRVLYEVWSENRYPWSSLHTWFINTAGSHWISSHSIIYFHLLSILLSRSSCTCNILQPIVSHPSQFQVFNDFQAPIHTKHHGCSCIKGARSSCCVLGSFTAR